MENNFDLLIDKIWTSFEVEVSKFCKKNPGYVLFDDAKSLFSTNFKFYYEYILRQFMVDDDKSLDRHKVASVILCSLIESDPVGISVKAKRKDFYLVTESISVSVALSYMYGQLCEEFRGEKQEGISVSEREIPYDNIFQNFYSMPEPFSCDRDFGLVLARDLYYAKKHFQLNPMSLSITLFLIELHSFDVAGIKRIYSKVEEKKMGYL